ncbi:MAG: hypothetical protein ACLT98_10260 [Eggerthellaceae bacterium]
MRLTLPYLDALAVRIGVVSVSPSWEYSDPSSANSVALRVDQVLDRIRMARELLQRTMRKPTRKRRGSAAHSSTRRGACASSTSGDALQANAVGKPGPKRVGGDANEGMPRIVATVQDKPLSGSDASHERVQVSGQHGEAMFDQRTKGPAAEQSASACRRRDARLARRHHVVKRRCIGSIAKRAVSFIKASESHPGRRCPYRHKRTRGIGGLASRAVAL